MTFALLAALYPIIFFMTWVSRPWVIRTGDHVRLHALEALKITMDAGFRAGIKGLAAWLVLAGLFKAWDPSSEVWSLVPLAFAGAIFVELYRIWDKPGSKILPGDTLFEKSSVHDPI